MLQSALAGTRLIAPVAALMLLVGGAAATLVPIQLDGEFDDWSGVSSAHTDGIGDGSTVDFGTVWVANDQDYLYVRFEVGGEVQPDEQQAMRLYLDTDMNAGTGTSFGGIGAELVWEFGFRDGTFTRGGNTTVYHDNVGLLVGPTVSNTEFEIALRRDAVPANGQALFPGNSLRFILRDMASGDVAPNSGSISYSFVAGSDVAPTLGLGRDDPAHIRLAGWNVQNDGLFDGGSAEAAQGRLLAAMDPDVIVVSEVWNHNANEVAAKMEQHLPSGAGEQWYAVGIDDGNVICSRFPFVQSWEVNPGYRITASLLELGPAHATDLLVIACHWRCCTADTDRQKEADSVIGFLRDAKDPGGIVTLPADTPFVLAGDLNLVGWRQQLDTILTGDIINQGSYGPDDAPDWDGGPFAYVRSRHPDGRAGYTWRNDFSTFYPGLLDWIMYSDSALTLHNNFILETRTMTPTTLAANGLQADDTFDASDHAPRVADFTLGTYISPVPDLNVATRAARLLPNAPNPFNPVTVLRFELDGPGRVELGVFDARGHLVRSFAPTLYPAGVHGVPWDGTDDGGRPAASGVYHVRMNVVVAGEAVQVSRPVVLVE